MFERRFDFSSLKYAAIKFASCYPRFNRQQKLAGSRKTHLKSNLNLTCSYYNSLNRSCQAILEKKYICRCFRQDIAMVSGEEINLESKKFSPWKTRGDQLKTLLYLVFSGKIKKLGKLGYTGNITIDDVDISKTKYSDGFIYICRPADVPGDINTGDWLSLTAALMKVPAGKTRDFMKLPGIQPHLGKQFKELTDLQASEILLSLIDLGKYRVYLVNDIAAGLSRDFFLRLNDRLEELAQTGPVVIYLSSVYIPIKEKEDKNGEMPFFPDNSWPHDIALIKRSNKVKSGK